MTTYDEALTEMVDMRNEISLNIFDASFILSRIFNINKPVVLVDLTERTKDALKGKWSIVEDIKKHGGKVDRFRDIMKEASLK